MNFLFILLVLVFPVTLYAAVTTTKAISCTMHIQCPTTHFCNSKQRVCVYKYAVNQTCARGIECTSDKCYASICRKSCKTDNDCSLKKEYCTTEKYCTEKHCYACIRNVQCANNNCRYSICERSTCLSALAALRKNK